MDDNGNGNGGGFSGAAAGNDWDLGNNAGADAHALTMPEAASLRPLQMEQHSSFLSDEVFFTVDLSDEDDGNKLVDRREAMMDDDEDGMYSYG